jgi:hypothetical protein
MAAALTAALSGAAAAQTGAPQQPATTPPSASAASAQTPTTAVIAGQTRSHWLASGFVGSNLTTNTENFDLDDSQASLNFGGQLGYLWRGIFGAETLADFSPSMDVTSVAFDSSPNVTSYMANAIGSVPLGAEGQFQPYVSGGVGTILMAADVNQLLIAQPVDSIGATQASVRSTQTRFGTNVGGGLLAYAGNFAVRTDVRYYHAASDATSPEDGTPADAITETALAGLAYWRANVGIGFRW